MSSSLIRGKYIIGRVIDNDRAEVIEDGAIFQRDGKIAEIGAEGDGDRYKLGILTTKDTKYTKNYWCPWCLGGDALNSPSWDGSFLSLALQLTRIKGDY